MGEKADAGRKKQDLRPLLVMLEPLTFKETGFGSYIL